MVEVLLSDASLLFMQSLDIKKTINAWSSLDSRIFVPHTNEEYEQLVASLDNLIDEVGEDESHL